jgi:hypothetical protein
MVVFLDSREIKVSRKAALTAYHHLTKAGASLESEAIKKIALR